jgi:hypothetical protein
MGPNVQEHILDEVDTFRDRNDVHRNTTERHIFHTIEQIGKRSTQRRAEAADRSHYLKFDDLHRALRSAVPRHAFSGVGSNVLQPTRRCGWSIYRRDPPSRSHHPRSPSSFKAIRFLLLPAPDRARDLRGPDGEFRAFPFCTSTPYG